MKKQKPLLHLFLALCLVIENPCLWRTYGDEHTYFVALNDIILPLQASNLPIWVDGFFCLPYTVFDYPVAGGDLGLSASYQRSSNLVSIYNEENRSLLFDLESGMCISGSAQVIQSFAGAVRNGVPYLPVVIVCSYFGLSYSYHDSDFGYMVRLRNQNSKMNVQDFLKYHEKTMAKMLEEYRQGPIAVVPDVEVAMKDTKLCVAFQMTEEAVDMSSLLEYWKVHGIFFFTAAQLESQGNYIRQLLGQGHSIGFSLMDSQGDMTEMLEELAYCQSLLAQQARRGSVTVLAPSSLRSDLEEAGYVCWQGGEGKEVNNAVSLVNSLKQGDNTVYLTLLHQKKAQEAWAQLMNSFGEKKFIPQIPLESVL